MESRQQITISATFCLACFLYLSTVLADTSQDFGAWLSPRTGIVRDFFYLEGGLPYLKNGSVKSYSEGLLYNFSLCDSISSQNVKDGLPIYQLQEAASDAPLFVGGTMFTTQYEFYTYGGLQFPSASAFTSSNGVLDYQFYGADDQEFLEKKYLPLGEDGVTNNVAFGAGVSVPSESLAFYFSGLQAPSGGPISWEGSGNDTASTLTSSMVILDTRVPADGSWSNKTLPSSILPRAEASLSWIPVGKKGLLIAVGGITNPADITAAQESNATDQDSTFLRQVPIYDIDGDQWYLQEVEVDSGMPATLAQFCTVVAFPPDKSSFQIYAYGGYDGTYNTSQQAFSQIWALSVPKFKWYPISVPGNSDLRRMGHSCEMLDANAMLAVGGSTEYGLGLKTNVFDIFDLSSQAWTGQYTPGNTTAYKVPDVVAKDISGAPMSSNISSTLATLFNNNAYVAAAPVWNFTCSKTKHHSSEASTIGPAVAVPVVVIALGIILFWYIRRRRKAGKRISFWSTSTKRESVRPDILKSDSESTHVPANANATAYELHNDYFARKPPRYNATEVSGTPVTTPPLSLLGRGSPQPGDAPGSPHSGPSELPQSTHPTSTRDSMSLRDHHMYPAGFASDGANSNWGDDLSARSQSEYAYPSMSARLFELPEQRASARPGGITEAVQNRGAQGTLGPSASHPTRPQHERNASSLSEARPMPASPTPEEDARRSRALDDMPSPPWSPTSPGEATGSKAAYQGKFDELFRERQS